MSLQISRHGLFVGNALRLLALAAPRPPLSRPPKKPSSAAGFPPQTRPGRPAAPRPSTHDQRADPLGDWRNAKPIASNGMVLVGIAVRI